jgi:hypothetical protein
MKTLIISLLSITVSVTCLVYTWRSDASNKKRFALMQEMSDKQDAMQANLNGVIDSSNYSLLHLEPLESKMPTIEGDVSNLQSQMMGAFDVLVSFQERLDGIDEAIAYLFDNALEKK